MNGVDPAELSALLDGELPPDREAQVRAAMEADPALRAGYERLSRLDAAWSAAAASAAFRPQPREIGRLRPRMIQCFGASVRNAPVKPPNPTSHGRTAFDSRSQERGQHSAPSPDRLVRPVPRRVGVRS